MFTFEFKLIISGCTFKVCRTKKIFEKIRYVMRNVECGFIKNNKTNR